MDVRHIAFLFALLFLVESNSAFCIYNNMITDSSFYVQARNGRDYGPKDFKQTIEPGDVKCCNYSNRDCTPSGTADEEMDFEFQFHWEHLGLFVEVSRCYAGGGFAIMGEELNYWGECTSPNGEVKKTKFHPK